MIKKSASDKYRKQNYLTARTLETNIMKIPTATLDVEGHPDIHNVTPLPIQTLALTTWLQDLHERPELCKTYGFALTAMSPAAVESPKEAVQWEDYQTTPEEEKMLKETATQAVATLEKDLELAVRQETHPVSSQPTPLLTDQESQIHLYG